MLFGDFGDFLRLALAEEARRTDLPEAVGPASDNVDADRRGEAGRLFHSCIERAKAPFPDPFGHDQQGPLSASHATVVSTIEYTQPSSPPLTSLPPRSRGCAGCIVETACL